MSEKDKKDEERSLDAPFPAHATYRTTDDWRSRLQEVLSELEEIQTRNQGQSFDGDDKFTWNRGGMERKIIEKTIVELEAREAVIRDLGGDGDGRGSNPGADFQTNRPGVTRGNDIYDLTTIRASVSDPSQARNELHERARRSVEDAQYGHHRADKSRIDDHMERLLANDTQDGRVAAHVLRTGSPAYRRAFFKMANYRGLTQEESRAVSLAVTLGGYAVPYIVDPTVIPTSDASVNPFRAVARVEQITGDTWQGVTSAGITAAFSGETVATTDNAPTLASPVISTEKAQAMVPYSIEAGMDWVGFESEMARMFQDAKDDLETTAFTTGTGTGQPFGILTGATVVVTTASSVVFGAADVYKLETSLGPRFRSRASFMANRGLFQMIRQLDTAGGSSLLLENIQLGMDPKTFGASNGLNLRVMGYPAYENSAMEYALSSVKLEAVLGDFSYYVIVDRIGLTIEQIPHLFGTDSNFPSGQRALYAYWRTGAKVVDAAAFVVMKGAA